MSASSTIPVSRCRRPNPRLDVVHAILVSHGHSDHLGSTPAIAAAKNAAVITAPNLANFIGKKVQAITGVPTPPCPPSPPGFGFNEMTVPRPGDHRRIRVHVPRSGITMDYDARGTCVNGCS